MSLEDELRKIDWKRLFTEWESFKPEKAFQDLDPKAFPKALIRPIPHFVEFFLKARKDLDYESATKYLYAFLLDKRYFERLNLLYFAFGLFDEQASLPGEVFSRTPLPHEDGIPSFRYFAQSDFYSILPNSE